MTKKKTLIFGLFVFSLLLVSVFNVYAIGQGVDTGVGNSIEIRNPIKADTLAGLLADILSIIVQIGIPILVIMVIYTGFTFVTARGNEDKIKEAKKAIVSVLIGSAVVIGAYAISVAIQNTVTQLQTGGSSTIGIPDLQAPAPGWD